MQHGEPRGTGLGRPGELHVSETPQKSLDKRKENRTPRNRFDDFEFAQSEYSRVGTKVTESRRCSEITFSSSAAKKDPIVS